ncbi:hypothetical protein BDF20DRAFT_817140 [Mycotypha africana]|uniref:uncharacterized protein n=1 Tax=Mycotypha africana TaxID=64632 RepID=UPI002301C22D|nr:uncharacterized protein BDF20DRAFT_817140 [Mycotypha africana]KAI8984789.1 hypothetical protein BDF20DRAFT_817140 [Mycotypha africana]
MAPTLRKRRRKFESSNRNESERKSKRPKADEVETGKDTIAKTNDEPTDADYNDRTDLEFESQQKPLNCRTDTDQDEEDDEEECDWETIEVSEGDREHLENEYYEHQPIYNDVEIVMEQQSRPTTTRKNMSAYEREYQRQLREWIHHSHVVCLTAHYKLRNIWCNQIKSACQSIIPSHFCRSRCQIKNTKNFLKAFVDWWRKENGFVITGPGLLTIPYNPTYLNGCQSLKDWIDARSSDENGDFIQDKEEFAQINQGTRDTNAELFVAMLRACEIFDDVRLVCSLQPVPYKIPPANKQSNSQESSTELKNEKRKARTTNKFNLRKPAPTPQVDYNTLLRDPFKAANRPPTVWAEVYCDTLKRWICVDPIRGFIDQPLLMEPNHKARNYQLSFVLAFDQTNQVTDVTRRYTARYEKAVFARERSLTKREKEAGMLSWSDLFLSQLCHRRVQRKRDRREQEEFAQNQSKEVMPTVFSGFKDHPLYALERHLLTYEIIYPKTKDQVLGKIKGEAIYPRQNVKTVRTAEAFYKIGRVIMEREQPVKMVKARAVTMEKKRLKEQAKQTGEDLLVACYGEWQTEPYKAPPVKDGKIPKNSYNNIDLFTPAMLPEGAVHLPYKGIASVAKKLGIDYAEAVVDFEFHKMRAVPVVNGIVIANENKWLVLEAWEEQEKEKAMKAFEKQEKEAIARWKKLIKSILIDARIDRDYGGHKEQQSVKERWDTFAANKEKSQGEYDTDEDGGGFLPNDNDAADSF